MQSGFPTANLPRSADTAAAVDRPGAAGRPAGDAARRHDDADAPRESAFSDMVETARSTEETPVRKPAGQAKAGERAIPSDAANTGNTPASGQSGPAPASGPPAPASATDAPADVQDMAAAGQKQTQTTSAETGKPAAPQPALQQIAAQPAPQTAQAASTGTAGTAPAPASGNTVVPAPAAAGAAQTPDSATDLATRAAPASANAQSGTSANSTTAAPAQNTGQATAPTATGPASNSSPGSQPGTAAPDRAHEPAKQAATAKTAETGAAAKAAITASSSPAASGTTPGKPAQTANAGTQTATPAQPGVASPAASENAAASSGPATTSGVQAGAQTQAATPGSATATTANATPQTGQAPAPLRETSHRPAILETGGNSANAKSSNGKSAAPAGQRVSTTPTGQGSVQSNGTVEGSNVASTVQQRDPNVSAMSPLMQALAQPAGNADQTPVQPLEIDADAAQSDAEIQLSRTGDVRASADRAGANLPRFAPHTAQHLAGQITRQFNNGQRVFDIRLDPAELGKVDVRLELRADNRVHAVLSAERPETLAELQRAARDLERSLNEAGLELAEEGLTFQMRDEGGDTPGSQRDPSATTMPIFAEGGETGLTDEATAPVVQQSKYGFLLSRRSGVDMRV